MDQLTRLEEKRIAIYKVYVIKQKIGILFILIAVLSFFVSLISQTPLLFIPGIILAIFSFVFFAKAARDYASFRTLIKRELIMGLIEKSFNQVTYDPEGFILLDTIMKSGMVKKPDRYHGEDFIEGIFNDVAFQVSDVDLKERVESRDSKGHRQVSYQTYFKGRWYIFKFQREFKEVLKIAEGRGINVHHHDLVKVETESIEFNQKFSVWASSDTYAFYHITPLMIEKLLKLEKLHKGSILYYYAHDELHVGINDRRDYMEMSLKKPLNELAIQDFMFDIDLIPAIISELKLDSSKFMDSTLGGKL